MELEAWSKLDVELSPESAAQLAEMKLVEVVASPVPGRWTLISNSRIGVAVGPEWELRVRPRLSIPKLFFLLAYARDEDGWQDQLAFLEHTDDLMEGIASSFSWQTLRVLEQGTLRGYVDKAERLTTIRGRIRFADQIARGAALPLPLEVSYTDYTEDIPENQILKTAAVRLLRLPRLPVVARRRLLKIRGALDDVTVLSRPREARAPLPTRLNARYQPALKLAELILQSASIDAPRGNVAATAFIFDMNKVFEDFVSTALREAMQPYGGELRLQWNGHLDIQRLIRIIPDLTWWVGGRCVAVADAKYKALRPAGMPNADAYQMLAYCTALALPKGFLVYAKDSGERVGAREVFNSSCRIEVRTLDVELAPAVLLAEVEHLGDEIAHNTQAIEAASAVAA